jgi:hypothetical protein
LPLCPPRRIRQSQHPSWFKTPTPALSHYKSEKIVSSGGPPALIDGARPALSGGLDHIAVGTRRHQDGERLYLMASGRPRMYTAAGHAGSLALRFRPTTIVPQQTMKATRPVQ